ACSCSPPIHAAYRTVTGPSAFRTLAQRRTILGAIAGGNLEVGQGMSMTRPETSLRPVGLTAIERCGGPAAIPAQETSMTRAQWGGKGHLCIGSRRKASSNELALFFGHLMRRHHLQCLDQRRVIELVPAIGRAHLHQLRGRSGLRQGDAEGLRTG